jgi:hypothetical protein
VTGPTPNPALDGLSDFYQPAPPAWTPQTIGWYGLFAIATILLLWLSVRAVRGWMANRYRREALKALATASPDQFSALLKRTAIVAWPRERVASLSGESWLSFLTQTSAIELFQAAPGNRMEDLALRSTPVSPEDEEILRSISAQWIRRHRVQV